MPHPLLVSRKPRIAEIVVITSDRGLAGGFNSNIARRTQRFLVENVGALREGSSSRPSGGRAGTPSAPGAWRSARTTPASTRTCATRRARPSRPSTRSAFLSGEVDAVYLCYNEFKSAISQKPVVVQLLPIETPPRAEPAAAPGRLQVRALARVAAGGAPAAARGHAGVARAARVGRLRARRPHERHGVGHQERRGHDRQPHAPVQPRAPGVRRPRSSWRSWAGPRPSSRFDGVAGLGRGLGLVHGTRGSTWSAPRAAGASRTARSCRSSARWWTSSSRPAGCRTSTPPWPSPTPPSTSARTTWSSRWPRTWARTPPAASPWTRPTAWCAACR